MTFCEKLDPGVNKAKSANKELYRGRLINIRPNYNTKWEINQIIEASKIINKLKQKLDGLVA